MKKKWLIVFGLLIVLVAAGFILSRVMQSPEVEVKQTEYREIKRSFTEEGEVVPLQERAVFSLHTARIKELLVDEGDLVSRGQVVAYLDDSQLHYTIQELEARLQGLEGEKLQLEQEPGAAQVESYRLRVQEAQESLEMARGNQERLDLLYLDVYELNVKQAQENLDSAQRNYSRMKRLFEAEVVSRVEYEEARELVTKADNHLAQQEQALKIFSEVEYEEARELVRKAEHNLEQQEKALQALYESYQPPKGSREVVDAQKRALQAQVDLVKHQAGQYRVTAPISGVVADIRAREGEITGPQASMMRLFQPENYHVEARVLTRDLYQLTDDMAVSLFLEVADKEVDFPGAVIQISPYAEKSHSPLGLEEERVKVTISPEVPDDVSIAPGYKLDVEFITEVLESELVVPKPALFTHQGEDALLVVENGLAALRYVKTGLETRQEVVVVDGLSEGDLVVLEPGANAITEGSRVSYRIVGNEG